MIYSYDYKDCISSTPVICTYTHTYIIDIIILSCTKHDHKMDHCLIFVYIYIKWNYSRIVCDHELHGTIFYLVSWFLYDNGNMFSKYN
jgi:hypothetical protein